MKLDLKTSSTQWVAEASRLLGLAPVFAMMCAVLMVVLAAFSVSDFLRLSQTERKSQELPEFSLSRLPVEQSLYEEYARVLARLSPSVRVSAGKGHIRIEVADAAQYSEFMYVLNSIQGVARDVVWQASEICLAGCPGQASVAIVQGMTEKVEVKLRGQGDE